jgi:hypothetical protein
LWALIEKFIYTGVSKFLTLLILRRKQMSFTFRLYKDIMDGTKKINDTRNEDGFEDTRATLRGEHHAESVDKLRQPRRHQVQFIDKAKEILHLSNKEDVTKARIMTGLMLLERAIIAKSYGENIFDITEQDLNATKSSEQSKTYRRSTYYRCLGINIGLTPENRLELEDFRHLLSKARSFITAQVYPNGLSSNGFNREHPFFAIPELKIPEYINMCTSLISEAEYRIVDRNEERLSAEIRKEIEDELRRKEELQRAAEEELRQKSGGSTSWFGGFGIWGSTTTPIPTVQNSGEISEQSKVLNPDLPQVEPSEGLGLR